MKEQLISFETAKLAKEKGFNWEVVNYIKLSTISKSLIEDECKPQNINSLQCGTIFSRPTQSLLQKWLREKHYIHIIVNTNTEMYWTFGLVNLGNENIFSLNGHTVYYKYEYNIYEEALEKGLQEALKLI